MTARPSRRKLAEMELSQVNAWLADEDAKLTTPAAPPPLSVRGHGMASRRPQADGVHAATTADPRVPAPSALGGGGGLPVPRRLAAAVRSLGLSLSGLLPLLLPDADPRVRAGDYSLPCEDVAAVLACDLDIALTPTEVAAMARTYGDDDGRPGLVDVTKLLQAAGLLPDADADGDGDGADAPAGATRGVASPAMPASPRVSRVPSPPLVEGPAG